MGECSNFECHGHVWGVKIRCPKCRHAKLYTCPDCGRELDSNRAIRCKPCSKDIKTLKANEFNRLNADKILKRRRINYPRIRDNCIVCNNELPKGKNKFCSDVCTASNRNLKLREKRKRLNKTSVEIIS